VYNRVYISVQRAKGMAIKQLTVKQLESLIKSNQSGRYAVGLGLYLNVSNDKSLTGEYNASIAKLLLGKHGYTDKQTLRADVRDVSAMSDAELEAIARG
jgi:F0F1-type ATP synthase gamma subunit